MVTRVTKLRILGGATLMALSFGLGACSTLESSGALPIGKLDKDALAAFEQCRDLTGLDRVRCASATTPSAMNLQFEGARNRADRGGLNHEGADHADNDGGDSGGNDGPDAGPGNGDGESPEGGEQPC